MPATSRRGLACGSKYAPDEARQGIPGTVVIEAVLCFAANEILWECLGDMACSCSTTAEGFRYHGQSENPVFSNCAPVESGVCDGRLAKGETLRAVAGVGGSVIRGRSLLYLTPSCRRSLVWRGAFRLLNLGTVFMARGLCVLRRICLWQNRCCM
jgi:hypothetical protein